MSWQRNAIALSAAGLVALASWESFRSQPYYDIGGVLTDGFGNTNNVVAGKPVTVEQGLDQLLKNVKTAEQAVNTCITKPMTQGEYDAFVKFTFNVGNKAFCNSTLVKKFNANDPKGACDELLRWVYVKGKKVKGLENRRKAEHQLCLSL
jgi:lysozyme